MNPWAIQSAVTGLFNLILGVYVYLKGQDRPLNRVFALFALSLAIWGVSEFGHRTVHSPEAAYLWIRAGGIGWCFMPSLYAHFILIFAQGEALLKRKFTYVLLYFPPMMFLYLFLATELIYNQQVIKMSWGYTSVPGRIAWSFFLYYFMAYLLTIYFIVKIRKKGSTLVKKQATPILIGTTFFLITASATNIVFPFFEIEVPELGSSLSIILTVCTLYATLRHKLFVIEPRLEDLKETVQRYTLEKGISYFIREDKLDKSYEIFIDQLLHGSFGLCLSKFEPSKVRDTFGLAYTPVVWVTFQAAENTVSPRDVDAIESVIYDFLSQAERPVVLIDCFNEIRLANGMDRTKNWLKRIRRTCNEKDCILIVSVNPDMFDEKELSMLEAKEEEEEEEE